MKQKTRDELSAELALSQEKATRLKEGDEYRRKEIAKAFGWYKKRNQYDYDYGDQEPRLPSWEEIFVEIGALMRDANYQQLANSVKIIHREIDELRLNTIQPL